jgi:hypothetical protein
MSENLETVKKKAQIFLEYQLEMLTSLSKLNCDEVREFNQWYQTHPKYLIVP